MLKKLKQYTHEEFEQSDLPFSIARLSPGIGAIIEGINLKENLNTETQNQIYNALLTYNVIFFRNQNITTEEHMKFGRYSVKAMFTYMDFLPVLG